MSDDRHQRDDMAFLMDRPEFRRFLWRVIQMGGIFDAVTDGSEGRHLAYYEGRRNLALAILQDAEAGQAIAHPQGYPLITAIQVFREEAQKPAPKKSNRQDRHDEVDPDADDDRP